MAQPSRRTLQSGRTVHVGAGCRGLSLLSLRRRRGAPLTPSVPLRHGARKSSADGGRPGRSRSREAFRSASRWPRRTPTRRRTAPRAMRRSGKCRNASCRLGSPRPRSLLPDAQPLLVEPVPCIGDGPIPDGANARERLLDAGWRRPGFVWPASGASLRTAAPAAASAHRLQAVRARGLRVATGAV